MNSRRTLALLVICSAPLFHGCEVAQVPPGAGYGPHPELPPAERNLLPTVHVARAVGWRDGAMPVAAPGLRVAAFATGLDHPRWLYRLPNGDVLVAESNAPPREGGGFLAWATRKVMSRAGAGTPSANRLTLLRDADGDGRAELREVFASGLNSPFGMALVGSRLFVANTDAVVEYEYVVGDTLSRGAPRRLVDLPANAPNGHWARNLLAGADGRELYVTVGSATNIADSGLDAERDRAAIHVIDLATGTRRPFATGLRNPNGLALEPRSGALWTVVNERDGIGSDLVPDYLTEVRDGAFHGWPWSWFGAHVDRRVRPSRPEKVAEARMPDYALGAHTASLGLAFVGATDLGGVVGEAAIVSQHGSWNRRPAAGYRVIAVPFRGGRPEGMPSDVLTGFLNARGEAQGRPVGVIRDGDRALLVADDVGNVIWRLSPE